MVDLALKRRRDRERHTFQREARKVWCEWCEAPKTARCSRHVTYFINCVRVLLGKCVIPYTEF